MKIANALIEEIDEELNYWEQIYKNDFTLNQTVQPFLKIVEVIEDNWFRKNQKEQYFLSIYKICSWVIFFRENHTNIKKDNPLSETQICLMEEVKNITSIFTKQNFPKWIESDPAGFQVATNHLQTALKNLGIAIEKPRRHTV